MTNIFYIVETNEGWYNLRVRKTHYCISCGPDKDKLLDKVYEYARKYKTEDRLLRALSKLSDCGKVSDATFDQMETRLRSGQDILAAEIRERMDAAMKTNREDSPYNRAKKRTSKKVTVPHKETPPPRPAHENGAQVKKVVPRKVKRIAL